MPPTSLYFSKSLSLDELTTDSITLLKMDRKEKELYFEGRAFGPFLEQIVLKMYALHLHTLVQKLLNVPVDCENNRILFVVMRVGESS